MIDKSRLEFECELLEEAYEPSGYSLFLTYKYPKPILAHGINGPRSIHSTHVSEYVDQDALDFVFECGFTIDAFILGAYNTLLARLVEKIAKEQLTSAEIERTK
jgi:hypothetical protein